jgi:glutamate dehydrogenase/leucine dehydrogenase
VRPDFDPALKPGLFRRYGKLIQQLGGIYQTGPDVGTSPADMDIIAETGSPHVFCRTPENGGAGDSGPSTALGVFSGMQAVCDQLFGDSSLAGRRVLVQGAGSVGGPLIDLLRGDDAEVLFTDVDQATIDYYRRDQGLSFVSDDNVYDTPCDIFAPCALGGILNRRTVARLKCRAVAGGANNQLREPTVAEDLQDRNILYAPDYAINIGGAMAIIGLETMGWTRSEADDHVGSVKETLRRIFELAAAENIDTDTAARKIAQARLSEASGY